MLRNLFWKTIRDNRYAFFWWSFGFVAISFYLMYFFPYISRYKEIIGVLDKLPPFIKNLVGDTSLMTTPEGFFNIQPFSMFAPMLFAIFAIVKGNDLIAGEKERGTLDLLLSYPLTRARIVIEKFSAICVMLGVMAVIFWLSMTVAAASFGITLNRLNLAAVIGSCLMLGILLAAMTLFAGCILLKRKRSSGIISGFVVVTYLINAYAPMVDVLKPYQYISPFYYYNGASPLIYGLNFGHFITLIVLSVLFFTGAVLFFRRKDLI